MENLQLGDLLTNARGGKYMPLEPPLDWRAAVPAEILYEPSSYDSEANADRVSLCLRLTPEAAEFVGCLERTAAAQLAAKKPQVFGAAHKPEQLLERLQTSARADKRTLRLKASLSRVRFWDASGQRLESPGELRGREALVAVQARQVWVMGQQWGVLLEARDIKLQDAEPAVCPF